MNTEDNDLIDVDSDYELDDDFDQKEEADFFSSFFDAFVYPLRKGGIFTLVAGVLTYLALCMIPSIFTFIIVIGAWIYLMAFLPKIVISSASGDDILPDWPDITDCTTEIVKPLILTSGTVFFCFLPALIYYHFTSSHGPICFLFIIAGIIYFPMAYVAVLLFESFLALNPVTIVCAIAKVPVQYLVVLAFSFLIFIINWGLTLVLEKLSIPGLILQSLFSLYFTIIVLRLIGLLYRTNRYRLNWFKSL